MDHFGIGAAMQGAARIYIQSARRTGRTTSLIESVKNGDRICFADKREAERVRRLCLARSVNVECITVDPEQADRILERGPTQGRTLFDHSWVEEYYLAAIARASAEINHLQHEASGFGEAHRETRRRAEKMLTWKY